MITIAITKEDINLDEALSSSIIKKDPLQGVVFSEKSQNEIQKKIEDALSMVKKINWAHIGPIL